jgi:hypothetical protein
LQPRYSPNGEYVIYGKNVVTATPFVSDIILYKIGVGIVDVLSLSGTTTTNSNQIIGDIQWFANSTHAVATVDLVANPNGSIDGLILIKRTGDTLSLEQTVDYTGDAPAITNISLTQDTYPLLAVGAGDPRAGTGGWVVSSVRRYLRTLKFDAATGLFLTTPVQNFTEGNVAAFAPSSAYPAP